MSAKYAMHRTATNEPFKPITILSIPSARFLAQGHEPLSPEAASPYAS